MGDRELSLERTDKELSRPGDKDFVESFYDLDLLTLAVRATGFTMMEEMERLQLIMRDPDAKIALAGLRHFRALMKEVAISSGRLATAKEKVVESHDGQTTVREVESGLQLSQRLTHRGGGSYPVTQRLPAADDPDGEGGTPDLGTGASNSGNATDRTESMWPAGGTDLGAAESS